MKFLFAIFFVLQLNSMLAQSKTFHDVVSPGGDTSFWYKYQQKQTNRLSIPSLDTYSTRGYYRVWTDKQVIDVWQNDKGQFLGKLTNWAEEYVPSDEKPTNRVFIKQNVINNDTAELLRQLFISSGILKLPTQDSIKGWLQGFDGIEFTIEYATRDDYFFKTYWTPKSQDALTEAKQVQEFVDSAFILANAEVLWRLFDKSIPFEMYSIGISGIYKVLSIKERKRYFRERKEYRRKHSQ